MTEDGGMIKIAFGFLVLAGALTCAAAVPPGADVIVAAETNGSFTTAAKYGDVQVHIEWKEPDFSKANYSGWVRGRSHLYFGDFCKLNFHDSYKSLDATWAPAPSDRLAGAVADEHAPLVNASRPWETWQSFDVVFRQPRWEGTNLVFTGELTAFLNGVLVQDKWAPQGGNRGHFRGMLSKPRSPKMKIAFSNMAKGLLVRNFWIRELGKGEVEK